MQSGYQRSKSSGVAVTQPAGCGGEEYEKKSKSKKYKIKAKAIKIYAARRLRRRSV
jgi:hypothetical protein